MQYLSFANSLNINVLIFIVEIRLNMLYLNFIIKYFQILEYF